MNRPRRSAPPGSSSCSPSCWRSSRPRSRSRRPAPSSFGAGADVAGQAAPQGRSLLIATGGSPMVAQMLTQIGSGIAEQGGVPLQTEGLAPPTADDPRGAGRSRFGGQYLPQGAMATLLRSTAFFDGAGATSAIAVLTCWAVAGTALIVITAVRQGRAAPA